MKRQKYPSRRFLIRSKFQKELACNAVSNLPEDDEIPIEVVIRERQKKRNLDQNALMWAGPLMDFEKQGYEGGRTYKAEIWHEFFKREFLPEAFDEELTREGYVKWSYLPNGDRTLVGSTTDLTVKGFSEYLEKIYAFGSQRGIQFHEVNREL